MNIHDFLLIKRNFLDILFCMPTINILSQVIVYLYQHNLLKINNLLQVENHHIQIASINQYIVHVYPLKLINTIPHIFMGASNSKSIG